jgi:hypothetical protein
MKNIIEITLENSKGIENYLEVVAKGIGKIGFRWLRSEMPSIEVHDFVAFLFLPIAMSTGRNLYIHGEGTKETIDNLESASDAWSTLLPNKYQSVSVEFKKRREEKRREEKRSLMFYSGGIDSTYALLSRVERNLEQDLITVQGMDFKLKDEDKFFTASKKTDKYASSFYKKRHYVRSNAYSLYKKYGIDAQMSHVFLLTGLGFMYHKDYSECVIAADLSYDQQFIAFPVGSSVATNRFFSTGEMQLLTEGQQLTRAQKIGVISKNRTVLDSISFCVDYSVRPENCGKCSKCLRTKVMFLASIGYVPENVFIDPTIEFNIEKLIFSKVKRVHFVFLKDAYTTALRNNNLEKLPWLEDAFSFAKKGF